MKSRIYKNEEWLREKYLKEDKSIPKIAILCDCSNNTIWTWLKKYNVKVRSVSEAKKGQLCGNNNPFYGKKHSKISKLKMSVAASKRSGVLNPFYGKRHSKEFIEKLKLRKGELHPCYGIKRSDVIDRNKKLKGDLNPSKRLEIRMKMSKSRTGKKLPEETKRKLSLLNKLDKNANWKGGISFEPYDSMFNKYTKNVVNRRDEFICQLCDLRVSDTKNIATHHIDYNKRNSSPSNLITLCRRCNAKANFNRNYWTKYFNSRLNGGLK